MNSSALYHIMNDKIPQVWTLIFQGSIPGKVFWQHHRNEATQLICSHFLLVLKLLTILLLNYNTYQRG